MAEFRPDLVMLDWMMPVMDGPTLFRQMKLRPETSGLPVVFITARASQRDLDELKVLGAAGTISKPFPPRTCPSSCGQSGRRCLSVVLRDLGLFLLEVSSEEADDFVGVAEARVPVFLDQLVDQALIVLQVLGQGAGWVLRWCIATSIAVSPSKRCLPVSI